MKKILYYTILFLMITSCEDVVDVNLPETESRLVVNALIRVDITQEFVPVEIKFTETSNFFEENQPTQVSSAVIFYGIPLENDPDSFEETFTASLSESVPGSGIYIPDTSLNEDQRIPTSILEPGMVFNLVIEHEEQRYSATSTYTTTAPIDAVRQGEEGLFNEDDIEVIVTFTDVPSIKNYYVFDFDFNNFLVVDDQFIDGQQFEFSFFYDEVLETGNEINISILGADLAFFNYMNRILEQTENTGGVFETPAATVRGNIIATADNDEIFDTIDRAESFALGYFTVVQEFKESFIIE